MNFDASKFDFGASNLKFEASNLKFEASNLKFEASNLKFEASNLKFGASNLKFEASNLKFEASNLKFEASNLKFEASNLKFEASNLKFEASNLKFGASNLKFEASNLKFEASNLKFEASNPDFGTSNPEFGTSDTDSDASKTDLGTSSAAPGLVPIGGPSPAPGVGHPSSTGGLADPAAGRWGIPGGSVNEKTGNVPDRSKRSCDRSVIRWKGHRGLLPEIPMDDIRRLIALASRRLAATSMLDWLSRAAMVAGGLVLALMIADRLPESPFVPWTWAAPVIAVLAVLVAVVGWSRQRRGERDVALVVDERLNLEERLVTALHFADRDDPFAQAAVADAVETARDPRTRERLRRGFPVAAPRAWWAGPLLVLLTVMASYFGQAGLFAGDEGGETAVDPVADASQAQVEAVLERIREQPELSRALEDVLGEDDGGPTDPEAPAAEMDAKREALKKVTDLNRRLQEILDGADGQTARALDQKMRQLESPESGAAKEMIDAMARGDFEAAGEALQELEDAVRSGELTEAQKQALAEQLEALAEQLEQLAEQQEQLEKALENAGLDPQLAQNPDALEQALEQSNLNEQQKQQLQQMAQAQQKASQMCKGMSQAASQMAQACQGGAQGGQQMSDAASMMASQLSQMEQLDQLMKQAMAAQSMCQGQCQGLGQGMGMQLALRQGKGGGTGGAGQGRGGQSPMAPTPSGTQMQKARVETTGEGPIIGRTLIEGPLEVGESSAQTREVLRELADGYDEAQTDVEVPRRYEQAHKHYFGQMKQWAARRLAEEDAPPTGPSSESGSSEAAEPSSTEPAAGEDD